MDRRPGWTLISCAALAALPLGCAQAPRPLSGDLFAPVMAVEQPVMHATAAEVASASGDLSTPTKAIILTPLQPHAPGTIEPLEALDAAARPDPTTRPDTADDAALQASVKLPPAGDVAAAPSPAPDPVPGTSLGVYTTLGTVLASVDGTPIYSGQVLRRLEKELTAKARALSESEFRDFARNEITRQRDEIIEDEVIFNLALNQLDEKDRELAQMITIKIKQEKVTAAGGSIEAAKRRSIADGEDFDDAMKRTYREIVHELVQHKVIEPMVHIGQDDLFKFYTANVGKLYSEKSRALFRVIQIDPAALTGPDTDQLALQKITAIRDKAVAGAEFVALASADNTDSYLKSHGGDPGGWMEPDTYRNEALEKAVWLLQPGEVTPVVKSEGAYYIAKLFDKKIGMTRPFSDAEVQADIYNRLRQQQISEQWELTREEMYGGHEITPPPEDRIDVAVDLAVQKFKPSQGGDAAP